MAATAAIGAAAVMIAPAAIPPPTAEPIAAIPEEMAAAPAVPDAPATEAKAAPVVPAVADMMVAAEPPTTAEAVLAAVPAVANAPAAPTTVDALGESDIFCLLIALQEIGGGTQPGQANS